MDYPINNEEAIRFLQDVLRYLAANYGGTLAHHLVSILVGESA